MVAATAPGLFADMIRCAQYTGMRQEEIASLKHRQVDINRESVQLVKTKTKRARSVPMDERAVGTYRGTPPYVSGEFVFWHDKGARYSNVSSRFREMTGRAAAEAKRAGKSFVRFRFHDLRHWFAVDYLRSRRGSIYELQQVLGHRSIKTTEIYLDFLTPEEKQDAMYGTGGHK